jgi:hypothetical protein
MKALLVFTKLLIALVVISCFAIARQRYQSEHRTEQTKFEQKLVGEWEGKDGLISGSMLFNRDHAVRLIIGNTVFDNDAAERDWGVKGARVEWRIDASHKPVWIDLIGKANGKEAIIMAGIIQFVTDKKILIRWPSGNEAATNRPADFVSDTADRDQLLLTKQG